MDFVRKTLDFLHRSIIAFSDKFGIQRAGAARVLGCASGDALGTRALLFQGMQRFQPGD